MALLKHTRAPWRFGPYRDPTGRRPPLRRGNLYAVLPGPRSGPRAVVLSVGLGGPQDIWLQVSRADARLIQAAPELLEAADALGQTPSGYCFCGSARAGERPDHEPACRRMRAAMAHAGAR